MEENRIAPFEDMSKDAWNCLLQMLAFSFVSGLRNPFSFHCPFQGGASFADRFCEFPVNVCCDVVSVPCSLVVTGCEGLISWLSSVLCFLVLCHFPKCVSLVHIRIKGEVGAAKLVK